MAKIVVKNLNKFYDNSVHAVIDANFEAEDKEFMVLVGPSGCGKSTVLRMIAGLEEISSGDIWIGDKLVNNVPPKDRDIAMVFQNYALYPHMTVYDNMAFALKLRGEDRQAIQEKVLYSAGLLGIQDMLKRKPAQLSGGQRQRVALGRAIVRNPKVFLFDEPLSNLDPAGSEEVMELLEELNQRGTTIIISTHDVDLAYRWSDRVCLLADGMVMDEGRPEDIFGDPRHLSGSGLRQPLILEVYDEISKRDLAAFGKRPRTVSELVGHLSPPNLRWMKVPPETEVGERIHPEGIDSVGPGRDKSEEVLVIHLQGGRAVVETLDKSVRIGRVIVYDTDGGDPQALSSLLADERIDLVGVMGTKSRAFAEKNQIVSDIGSNVIDRTILRALCGEAVLVITNGGVVEHAKRRIEEYCRQSGMKIEVSVVGRGADRAGSTPVPAPANAGKRR